MAILALLGQLLSPASTINEGLPFAWRQKVAPLPLLWEESVQFNNWQDDEIEREPCSHSRFGSLLMSCQLANFHVVQPMPTKDSQRRGNRCAW